MPDEFRRNDMSRGRQYIELEGLFAYGVLGIFRIVRGYADLRDLAAISVPYEMADTDQPRRVVGHQRRLDARHAEELQRYFERSDSRFIPEVKALAIVGPKR